MSDQRPEAKREGISPVRGRAPYEAPRVVEVATLADVVRKSGPNPDASPANPTRT